MIIERVLTNIRSNYSRQLVEKVEIEKQGTFSTEAVILENHDKHGQDSQQNDHSAENETQTQNGTQQHHTMPAQAQVDLTADKAAQSQEDHKSAVDVLA